MATIARYISLCWLVFLSVIPFIAAVTEKDPYFKRIGFVFLFFNSIVMALIEFDFRNKRR